MDIVRIFDDENFLLAVRVDPEGSDAFNEIFNQLTDIEFLYDFFTRNQDDLRRDIWKGVSVDEAVLQTHHEAIELVKQFRNLCGQSHERIVRYLSSKFRPLYKQQARIDHLDKQKAYGLGRNSWIRIYALRVDDEMFVVTGGTIKLTATMEEREHTNLELIKLNRYRDFLLAQGIVDEEGVIDFFEF